MQKPQILQISISDFGLQPKHQTRDAANAISFEK
jgi:hypothetical protein